MGNRSQRKRIESLRRVILKHRQKIALEQAADFPRGGLIDHWRSEIENFQKQLDRTEEQLQKHRRKRKRGRDVTS